jgi:hypothetical protein
MILSQVSKQLSWFWSFEWIEFFDCVFGVFAFALVLNEKCRRLGWLEYGWLGVFIAQPLFQPLLSMGTRDSPVVHQTWYCSLSGACHVSRPLGFGAVDRWSLLSSCYTRQSGGTPDSPCVLTSQLWLLTFALCTFLLFTEVNRWHRWPLLRWLTGHVRCIPNSPVNYSGASPTETREWPDRGVLGLGIGRCPVRHWQHFH